MSNKRNLPSSKNISDLVRNTSNQLNNTTKKVKDDLVSAFSNQLKNASERERKLMEGELLVYLEELFEKLHDEGLEKEERKQLLRQYKLYVHLAKELNFKMALDQIKRHEELRDQEKIEKKKRKKKKTEKKLKRKLEKKLGKETNKKTNQVIGNENNTGNNKATQEGNGIQVNGNGNVVILGGHYREGTTNFQNVPEFQLDAPISGEKNHREKPTQEKPVEEKPTQEKPVEEKPVEEKPAEEKPVEEKPTEEKPVEEKPVEEKPVEEKPVEEKPVEEKPAEEKPAEEKPAEEKPADDYEFDLTASLSDVENIHLENARYKAEEQIKEKYRNLNKSNVVIKLAGKLKLFLWRGLTRKKLIQEEMKKAKNKPFGDDAAVNLELGKGVNRQELESFFQWKNADPESKNDDSEWKNADVVFKDIPELNQLSIDFIKGKVSEGDFQTQFNTIVKNQNRQERQKNGIKNINYLGTNILEKLKFEKAQLELVNELAERLDQGADTTEVQTKIEDFLKNYQKNPDFLEKIKADLAARNITNIKGYFKLQKENRAMALKNLKMKLKLFTDKKSAYQIDNSDREKGWIYELGKKLDKLPRLAQTAGFAGFAGIGALVGVTGGALGLGVFGTSLLTTGTFAGMTGFKNFIKKWTHYTKEQNTHEKNMTRNLSNELAKIEKRKQDSLLKGVKNLYRSYRAGRQLNLYNNATQDFFGTKEISKKLLDFGATLNTPSDAEKAEILNTLVDAKARLEAYYETGHNFLASEDLAHIESDMNELHMAIDMVCKKLGLKYAEIDSETIKKNLISDYNNSFSVFKKQRAKLARKYGAVTGVASFLSAWGLQKMMGTGMYSQEAVPGSTISKPNISGKEYFGLGGTELGDTDNGGGQIYDGVKNAFGKLENNATVNIHYGAGTDATQVLPGSKFLDASVYHDKLTEVSNEIDTLSLTKPQKDAFIKQLEDQPWKADWTKGFTSDYLHGQRCAKGLLEIARGLANTKSEIVPEFSYDSAMNVAGSKIREQSERFFDINMEIVENIPGKPGSGRSWWVPITRFDNTFKKDPEKSGSSSTTSTPDNSTTPTPGDSANQGPITKEEAEKKNEEAEKKNEKTEKKNEGAEKKNEEAEKKNEEAEKKNEEAEKKNEEAEKKNEEAEKKNEVKFVKFRDLNKKEFDKEFDFENKIYLTHHTIKDSAENIVKTGLHHHGVLQGTTNLVGEDIFKHLENAENGNYTHRNSDTVVILEFDKKEFDINPEEKSVIDRIGEKLMLDNATNENKFTVPQQYIKVVVELGPKPKNLVDSTNGGENSNTNQGSPTITPQVPDSIVNEQNSDNEAISQDRADKKAREFLDKYTEYRKLFMNDGDKDIGELLKEFYSKISESGTAKKSPEERFKFYEGAIQRLEERKKEIDRILSERKTPSQ